MASKAFWESIKKTIDAGGKTKDVGDTAIDTANDVIEGEGPIQSATSNFAKYLVSGLVGGFGTTATAIAAYFAPPWAKGVVILEGAIFTYHGSNYAGEQADKFVDKLFEASKKFEVPKGIKKYTVGSGGIIIDRETGKLVTPESPEVPAELRSFMNSIKELFNDSNSSMTDDQKWEYLTKVSELKSVKAEIASEGSQGGSNPGSEMTEDQYSEYLKNDPGATKIHYHDDMTDDEYSQYLKQDPGATKMHYDPSQMTEGQQAESLYKRKAA